MTILDFVSEMSSIKVEFNVLLFVGKTAAKDLTQHNKFFMVCTLVATSSDLASIQDQILASPTIPTLQEVFSCLLHVSFVSPPGATTRDSFALVFSSV